MSDYINAAQQRLLKAVLILAGNELNGLAPSDLAKALDTNPSNVTRDLANLKEAGLAEQITETGRWRLGPKVVQIAVEFFTNLERSQSRVDEIKQRYTRT
ncbi:MAG: ArsR family transcriptional regulator [Dechloromonas sp.]|nr:ArsR family transcriptional regulator [Dechloromonas sp.]